mgnify:CR=1 FL=1
MSTRPKVTTTSLRNKKRKGQKITLLTAYDSPMAEFINAAGVDVVLVSDAVGTVGLGRAEAVSVSVEEMIYHTQAVARGAGRALSVPPAPRAGVTLSSNAGRKPAGTAARASWRSRVR